MRSSGQRNANLRNESMDWRDQGLLTNCTLQQKVCFSRRGGAVGGPDKSDGESWTHRGHGNESGEELPKEARLYGKGA